MQTIIKAPNTKKVGDTLEIENNTYLIVDREMLDQYIKDGKDCRFVITTHVTDMSCLFKEIKDFNQDISRWDVSNVISMVEMFMICESFNQDISKWDVSKVNEMNGMFAFAYSFNQDISNWDVSNVKKMIGAFWCAKSFNQDISKWDISNVLNMEMFLYGAESYKQDITKWEKSLDESTLNYLKENNGIKVEKQIVSFESYEKKIEYIENEIGAKYPDIFKELLYSLKTNDSITLHFPFEDYQILNSLLNDENFYEYDRSEDCILWSKNNQINSDIIKLPIAKVTKGNESQYIFFEAKKGSESKGEIFYEDVSLTDPGKVKISNSIDFIMGIVNVNNNEAIIDCSQKSFEDYMKIIVPSEEITSLDEDFTVRLNKSENECDNHFDLDLGATIFEDEDESATFSKIEVITNISNSNFNVTSVRYYYNSIPGFQWNIERNFNVFYSNFVITIDCLVKSMIFLHEQNLLKSEDFMKSIDMDMVIEQIKKGFVQVDYS
ncbi:BspA family leucine-rich repeat surface protein [Flammeovirga kamogawensis]|uniref:DUF285 domain-containing protein n=1 Tax=Flammeovirga kamogawensis TaxID=373891 RepID=A0ABX8H4P2_9BACT|nr:BspA family leucine-rich repeat surface protein [Flammeovirga kamogawensis]MBB6463856.1 surface protein [Flammeovirga kamogawensis]QWG10781.1 DUF285 domain-containing protein [Flammeovirga kamogawensis]